VLERFEKAIDPEKLRAWALPYLRDEGATNNSDIIPPKEISHLVHFTVMVDGSGTTGPRFVWLWIQMGGFGPYEAILVGAPDAKIDPPPLPAILIKWRDGIYYQVFYN
jgi:hypothetical protein